MNTLFHRGLGLSDAYRRVNAPGALCYAYIMIGRAALLILLLALVFPGESGVCADPPGWFPANPLQPAGRPKTGDPAPKGVPSMIPAAPAPEPIPQTPAPAAVAATPTERPRALSCEDVCSQGGLKIVFTLERGRIGSQSRVELEGGEAFDMLAYAESCPHAETKEISPRA